MFVSDSNLFTNDFVKLKVVNLEGYVWDVDAAQDFTMDKLKTMALCHFYNPLESVKVTPNFRLVLVSERRCSENTTEKLHIIVTILVRRITDELLLVECRRPLAKEPSNDESLRGPTDEEIKAATQHVEPKNISKQHPPLECTADSEIRKILISLVEASARILTPSPNADEVFAVIRERLESKSSGKTEPDILSVKQLVDMGFSEQQASEALRRNRMNQTEALDWLLEQQSDSASPRSEPPASSTVVASSSKYRHELVKQLSHTESKQQCVSKTVASLLESFRAFKRSDFKPNEKALKNLVEMGFSEQDVKDALHITGNNQSSACEWLLGERRPSLEDMDVGLDPQGAIYKAIMANPTIQLSLNNPKILLDASPILSQIFKTYHAEKHALQMNLLVELQQQTLNHT
uniref:UBA domain-containing protein n=1 Tax=Timema shepardi TaxID=629360 RepID=A0A7R9AN47_TIMSH|nr:unnamed protein product [Timema shepardi]